MKTTDEGCFRLEGMAQGIMQISPPAVPTSRFAESSFSLGLSLVGKMIFLGLACQVSMDNGFTFDDSAMIFGNDLVSNYLLEEILLPDHSMASTRDEESVTHVYHGSIIGWTGRQDRILILLTSYCISLLTGSCFSSLVH